MFRTSFQVTKLELRLLQSDRLLETQLEDVKKDEERQMAAIYEEYKAKNDSMEKLVKSRKTLFQKADETVTLLLKENRMLRPKNEKLKTYIATFKTLNSRLEE
jgi:hypothetical protein